MTLRPNAFQVTNAIVDEYGIYLTDKEFRILVVLYRKIAGSSIVKHRRPSEATLARLSSMSIETASKQLDSLLHFGIITVAEEAEYEKKKARLFDLQDDSSKVKLDELTKRNAARKALNLARIQAARAANPKVADTCATGNGAIPVPQGTADTCATDNIKIQFEKPNEKATPDGVGLSSEERNALKDPVSAAIFWGTKKQDWAKEIKNDTRLPDRFREGFILFSEEFPQATYSRMMWLGRQAANGEEFLRRLGLVEDKKALVKKAAFLASKATEKTPQYAITQPFQLVRYMDAVISTTSKRTEQKPAYEFDTTLLEGFGNV